MTTPAPASDLDRVEQIRARASAAALGPLARTCPSCGSGPGVPCYGNGPMREGHPGRVAHNDPADIPWLLARLAAQDATIKRLERGAETDSAAYDRLHDTADRLAYAIAPMEELGEHSSGNDPWENAIEAVARMHARHAAQGAATGL